MSATVEKICALFKKVYPSLLNMEFHNLPGHRYSPHEARSIMHGITVARQVCEISEDIHEAHAMYYSLMDGKCEASFPKIIKAACK